MLQLKGRIILIVSLLSLGLYVQANSKVIDTVKFGNTQEFQFIALTDDNGQIQDMGVLEIGLIGTRTLTNVDADALNPLELYRTLNNNHETPEIMHKLYGASTSGVWLAETITENNDRIFHAKDMENCPDDVPLIGFDDSSTGYDYHNELDNVAFLNLFVSDYFMWRRYNTNRIRLGICVQSSTDYTRIFIKYRTAGSNNWQTAFEDYYVPEGYNYHWRCNSCAGYDWWLQIDPVESGIYDIRADWD
ncbi:hypothetical protein [Microbulbifer spongiae]|uniref:SCP domain-containing protein n=1 Tax=Microbulbifer spongiae TaxID=2944933 RepID=A0ABY9EAZ0_9GAMM|nr:hypothetical protein [Microbulbifer sp. MI-G]WKD50184.1 hypothetical protein M8T91_01770 [Microbulbifer sp. MI-G]